MGAVTGVDRMVASVRHAPGKFNMPEDKVRPFEKLMMMLEGRLLDGMIFQVNQCSDENENESDDDDNGTGQVSGWQDFPGKPV